MKYINEDLNLFINLKNPINLENFLPNKVEINKKSIYNNLKKITEKNLKRKIANNIEVNNNNNLAIDNNSQNIDCIDSSNNYSNNYNEHQVKNLSDHSDELNIVNNNKIIHSNEFPYDNIEESELIKILQKIQNDYRIKQEEEDLKINDYPFIKKFSNLKYDDKNKISVSKIISIDQYKEDYKDQEYINSISYIKDKYSVEGLRKIRGDGNCLYRSYFYQYIEINVLECFNNSIFGSNLLKKLFNNIKDTNLVGEKYIFFENHFEENIKCKDFEFLKNNCLVVLKVLITLID